MKPLDILAGLPTRHTGIESWDDRTVGRIIAILKQAWEQSVETVRG